MTCGFKIKQFSFMDAGAGQHSKIASFKAFAILSVVFYPFIFLLGSDLVIFNFADSFINE